MAKKNKENKEEKTGKQIFLEYLRVIATAIVLALFVRSFIVQAFQIPSGSMIPTFLEGDRVLVTKYDYGIRNPINNKVWFGSGKPKRYDVAIFIYPEEPDKDFVKRIIALPGEKVEIKDAKLYINDKLETDSFAKYNPQYESFISRNFGPYLVPENKYFVLGDNRDNSSDSRSWGFVDYSYMRGKAWRLYWSWDMLGKDRGFFKRIRWSRFGQKII